MARTIHRYGDDDLSNFSKNCKPPPPPGDKHLWELQYCRFWGWNWVQKQSVVRDKMDLSCEVPVKDVNYECFKSTESRKLKKKHLKDLYECLCFKKRPKYVPDPNKFYATPSNSNTCVCQTVTNDTNACVKNCGIQESVAEPNDSVKKIDIERKVSKRRSKDRCSEQSFVRVSDSDSCRCGCDQYRPSSTEDSVQYVRVICNCCKPEKLQPSSERSIHDCQTQTSVSKLPVASAETQKCTSKRICGTQTLPKCKKKRHVTVFCCHCCQCECSCQNNSGDCKNKREETAKIRVVSSASVSKPTQSCKATTESPTWECSANRQFMDLKNIYQFTEVPNVWLKSLDRYKPWDTIFYNRNLATKHPLIHGTRSDILDRSYRHKIGDEFESPVSGKVYKLSPHKLQTLKNEDHTTNFPDPIEVNKNVEYLRNLEEQLKIDLNSRTMLDKICDAILFRNEKKFDLADVNGSSGKSITNCNSSLVQTINYPHEEKNPTRNVGLLTDKSTLTASKRKSLPTSFMFYDQCPQIIPCEQESGSFLDTTLSPSGDSNTSYRFNSLLAKEKPFEFNSFLFSKSYSNYTKGFKRNAPSSNQVPVKRFKSTSDTSTTGAINNMEALFRRMQDIIYIDTPKNSNTIISQYEKKEKFNNTFKDKNNQSGSENITYFPTAEINNDDYIIDDPFSSSENMLGRLNNVKSESSDTSLFSKIDEIINRSQATENQIQQFVLNLPIKKSESKRDYANTELIEKILNTKSSEVSDGLTTIMESSDERSDDNFHRERRQGQPACGVFGKNDIGSTKESR